MSLTLGAFRADLLPSFKYKVSTKLSQNVNGLPLQASCFDNSSFPCRGYRGRASIRQIRIVPVGGRPYRDGGDSGYWYPSFDSIRRFWKTLFFRPKPVITEQLVQSPTYHSVNVYPARSVLAQSACELWINVRNDGRTPIRNMRARVKILLLPTSSLAEQGKESRPTNLLRRLKNAILLSDLFFGTALPFTRGTPFARTPRGAISLPWIQADYQDAYVLDLAPHSDEASVRIALACTVDAVGKKEIDKALFGPRKTTQYDTVVQIGRALPSLVDSKIPPEGQTPFDYVVKFWIIADNLTSEVSQIVHVKIPEGLDTIIFDSMKKGTKSFAAVDAFFEATLL